jgi:hypothetical protein
MGYAEAFDWLAKLVAWRRNWARQVGTVGAMDLLGISWEIIYNWD